MAHTVLRSAPGLAPMFVKAVLTGPLRRGGALPESVYELADQRIDPEHLANYDGVCGFRLPIGCRQPTCMCWRSRSRSR